MDSRDLWIPRVVTTIQGGVSIRMPGTRRGAGQAVLMPALDRRRVAPVGEAGVGRDDQGSALVALRHDPEEVRGVQDVKMNVKLAGSCMCRSSTDGWNDKSESARVLRYGKLAMRSPECMQRLYRSSCSASPRFSSAQVPFQFRSSPDYTVLTHSARRAVRSTTARLRA